MTRAVRTSTSAQRNTSTATPARPSAQNQQTLFATLNISPPPTAYVKPPRPPHTTRGVSSALWEHAELENSQPIFSKIKGKETVRIFRCNHCIALSKTIIKEYHMIGGNANFREHLFKAHRITVSTAMEDAIENHTTAMHAIKGQSHWNNNIRKRKRLVSKNNMDAKQLRSLFLNWVAADNLPFNLVKLETFRAFLNYINPFTDTLLPLSHNTI